MFLVGCNTLCVDDDQKPAVHEQETRVDWATTLVIGAACFLVISLILAYWHPSGSACAREHPTGKIFPKGEIIHFERKLSFHLHVTFYIIHVYHNVEQAGKYAVSSSLLIQVFFPTEDN